MSPVVLILIILIILPFVDLRTPMTAEQAAAFSPRLRYMLGCNASAPVRG